MGVRCSWLVYSCMVEFLVNLVLDVYIFSPWDTDDIW